MKSFIIYLFLFFSLLATKAHAYIDPGSGSIIIQAIIGAIATVVTTASIYWNKLKNFFNKNKKKDDEENEK